MDGDPTPALTGRRRTRPTSIGCRKPRQPKPGRAPLIAGQAAVQTNRATSETRVVPNFCPGPPGPELHQKCGRAAILDQPRLYELPRRLRLNEWALAGNWTVNNQAAALNEPNGRVAYRFHARDVHLVMGPTTPVRSVRFRVR